MDPASARHPTTVSRQDPTRAAVRFRALGVACSLLGFALATCAFAQPGARGYVDMVYVPQTGKVLVFGGQASPNPPFPAIGGTWWWDPVEASWTEVTGDPQPSPRSAGHLELHPPSGKVVHFGGGEATSSGYRTFDETWLFDPSSDSWTLLEFDGPTPEATIGEQFAYHAAADVFVLYGGYTLSGSGRFLRHTWHLDLDARSWTLVEPERSPIGRNYNGFAYDPNHELLVMSGGIYGVRDETWTYDPHRTTWTLVERRADAPEVGYSRLVWDVDAEALVRVGGLGPGAAPVWTYDLANNVWTEALPAGDAPHVSRHAATSVPGLGIVVFGGLPDGADAFTAALWVVNAADGTWEAR